MPSCGLVLRVRLCHRLQAALAGCEAARRGLEAAHEGGGGEARAAHARAAEAEARAGVLSRLLDTERAQAAAALAVVQEEVASLRVGGWRALEGLLDMGVHVHGTGRAPGSYA